MSHSCFSKGILLAGGSGTRLYPSTESVSKQLLPVYDKPLVYYSLSTLMLAGIQDILVIVTPRDLASFEHLLGDGRRFGISISFAVQEKPEGIAQGLLIAREFIGKESVALVLGDNIYFGQGFRNRLAQATRRKAGATIFAYRVKDPQRYGVVQLNTAGEPVSIEEKPPYPRSDMAITGLYFYDNSVVDIVEHLQPSARGELEISDVNRAYLERSMLNVEILSRGFAWLDTGTHESMLQASNFVQTIEARQGVKICCPEEVAYQLGFISKADIRAQSALIPGEYGRYLAEMVEPKCFAPPVIEGGASPHEERNPT